MRSRRRRFGSSLDMTPRACGRALYGASEAHAIEETLAAELDADVIALEAADHLARLAGRALVQDQAVELRDLERERALERAQRAQMHRDHAAAPLSAGPANRPAVGDVEANPLVREIARAADTAPQLGAHVSAPPPTGPKIEITGASVDAASRVVVTVRVSRDERPLPLDAARALGPAWTLAALSPDPVNPAALRVWRSLIQTGAEKHANLPVAGPGTPEANVLHDEAARQPGAETSGAWVEQGGGEFTYTF